MSEWTEAVPNSVDTEKWDRVGTLQGIYAAKKENVGENESTLYTIKTSDKDYAVWGSTVLDDRFALVPVGSEIRLECLGKVKSEKGGREYYNYKLEWRPAPFQEAGAPVVPDKKPADVVPSDLDGDVSLDDIPF